MVRTIAIGLALLIADPVLAAHASMSIAPSKDGRPAAILHIHRHGRSRRIARNTFDRHAAAVAAVCRSRVDATPSGQDIAECCRRNAIADIAPNITTRIGRVQPWVRNAAVG